MATAIDKIMLAKKLLEQQIYELLTNFSEEMNVSIDHVDLLHVLMDDYNNHKSRRELVEVHIEIKI